MATSMLEHPLRGLFVAALITLVSVGVAWIAGVDPAGTILLLGGAALFLLFVKDLRVIVPVLIVLIPFGNKYPMSFGNLYVATGVLMIGYAAWLGRAAVVHKPLRFTQSPVIGALIFLMGVLFVSAMQNVEHFLTNNLLFLRFIQFFLYTGTFFLVLQMSFSRRAVKTLLVLVMLAGIGQGLIGVWQWQTSPGMYLTGTFDEMHNHYAIYILLMSMLLMGVLLETRRRWLAVLAMLGSGLFLYCLVLAFSRTGYVAYVVSLLAFLWLPVRRGRKIGLGVGLAAFLALVYVIVPSDVIQRAQAIFSTFSGGEMALSFFYRLQMWDLALQDFVSSPVIGRGTWLYELTDNFYVKTLGEAGLLGIGAVIYLMVSIFREEKRIIAARVRDDFVRGIGLGLLPATVGCLVIYNLTGDFLQVHKFMGVFWIVLALLIKYGARGGGGGEVPTTAAGGTRA
ncbi:MAG: O-antigen ligase family protein [bacterium]